MPSEEEKLARQVSRSHDRKHAGNRAANDWLSSKRFVCTHVCTLSIVEETNIYARSTGAYLERRDSNMANRRPSEQMHNNNKKEEQDRIKSNRVVVVCAAPLPVHMG